MSDEEIARSWRTAKYPARQLTILAELNAVSLREMQIKLLRLGFREVEFTVKGRGKIRIVDPSRVEALCAQGLGDAEIAKVLKVHSATVRDWREKLGLW